VALTEKDVNRISDKVALGVAIAFQKHQEAHDNLHIRINRLNTKIAYAAGGLGVLIFVIETSIKIWGK